MGEYIDALQFAGGSFSLMSRKALAEIIGEKRGQPGCFPTQSKTDKKTLFRSGDAYG